MTANIKENNDDKKDEKTKEMEKAHKPGTAKQLNIF